jgi:hypothetical protein
MRITRVDHVDVRSVPMRLSDPCGIAYGTVEQVANVSLRGGRLGASSVRRTRTARVAVSWRLRGS